MWLFQQIVNKTSRAYHGELINFVIELLHGEGDEGSNFVLEFNKHNSLP